MGPLYRRHGGTPLWYLVKTICIWRRSMVIFSWVRQSVGTSSIWAWGIQLVGSISRKTILIITTVDMSDTFPKLFYSHYYYQCAACILPAYFQYPPTTKERKILNHLKLLVYLMSIVLSFVFEHCDLLLDIFVVWKRYNFISHLLIAVQ